MLNRFQRCSSNYPYYGYLNRYTPDLLRRYQSERNYFIGRQGAYKTLVKKTGAASSSYDQSFNLTYKVPSIITNFSIRIGIFYCLIGTFIIVFFSGDPDRVYIRANFKYGYKVHEQPVSPVRYETLYLQHYRSQI